MTVQVLETAGPVNTRTRAMLEEASRIAGINLVITQGMNPGGVTASAGTHDGSGVVDVRVTGWSDTIRTRVVKALRTVGFAAWLRLPSEGNWPTHVHAVAMGDPGLSSAARRQVTAYRKGRNGLANNGTDNGPKGFTGVTWESYLKAHPPEDTMTVEQMTELKNYIEDRTQAYAEANNNYTRQVLSSTAKAIMSAAASDEDATQASLADLRKELDELVTPKVAPAK